MTEKQFDEMIGTALNKIAEEEGERLMEQDLSHITFSSGFKRKMNKLFSELGIQKPHPEEEF